MDSGLLVGLIREHLVDDFNHNEGHAQEKLCQASGYIVIAQLVDEE